MLANTEHIEPDLVGEHDLLDKILHATGGHRRVMRRPRIGFAERVDAEFHGEFSLICRRRSSEVIP